MDLYPAQSARKRGLTPGERHSALIALAREQRQIIMREKYDEDDLQSMLIRVENDLRPLHHNE